MKVQWQQNNDAATDTVRPRQKTDVQTTSLSSKGNFAPHLSQKILTLVLLPSLLPNCTLENLNVFVIIKNMIKMLNYIHFSINLY